MARKIDAPTLTILSRVTVSGNNIHLTCGTLDRKAYEAVNKVLAAMGGKWNRKAQAHVFNDDPTGKLEQVLLTGEIIAPQDFGFFPTPPDLAKRVVALADLTPDSTVLEPSAGHGALADEVAKIVTRFKLQCVELLPDNVKVLNDKGYAAYEGDFLALQGFASPFSRVVMNPPFSVAGAPQADIDHVLHAYDMVAPGGRLVAIMSGGVMFRENRKTVAFRELVETRGHIEVNPDGAFKTSGTSVSTVTVVLNK